MGVRPGGELADARQLGVVAAGHPLSASAGAQALSAGGNAVDAALGAMLASFVCEPLLTGLGAGGYMLVCVPDAEEVLLDFFVAAPGHGLAPGDHGDLVPVEVSFGDAAQTFHIGPASVGVPGVPAGVAEASRRFGRLPLAALAAPAAALARSGVEVTPEQGYLIEILAGLWGSTPEGAQLFAPSGTAAVVGERLCQPELARALELLGAEGEEPFYRGEPAREVVRWLRERGGLLTSADLARYRVVERRPIEVAYRGRSILTNPPPSAGGILIADALARLDAAPAPVAPTSIVAAMERSQSLRTPDFLDALDEPDFTARFLAGGGRLGSTTHIATLDAAGMACSVTCSNGSSSGVVVPGTGLHMNNMLGEQDLSPHGFHGHPPGRRLPSMMAPTIVRREGRPELVLGSAGSNRIRSAILQTVLRVVDEGMTADEAVRAPRLHYEDGTVYAEPGAALTGIEATGRRVVRFRSRNLFFGGVQAVERDARGRFWGGGDPRRGGAAVVVR